MPNQSMLLDRRRRGATLVEFAFVVPILFLLVFGLMEFSRMAMVYHVITNAAREGSRRGIVPGATASDVTTAVNDALAAGQVSGAVVVVTPSDLSTLNAGDPLTVSVTVNYSTVGWLPVPKFLGSKILDTESVMLREGK